MEKKHKSPLLESLRTVIVLTLVCAVITAVVSGINALTLPKINANLDAEMNAAFVEMFGEGMSFSVLNIDSSANAVYKVRADGKTYYSVNISSPGFESDIMMLVSFEESGKIAGVKIISQGETPGIGTRVDDDSFLSRFIGKSSPDEVDSLTGATISSKAVKTGIREAREILVSNNLIG